MSAPEVCLHCGGVDMHYDDCAWPTMGQSLNPEHEAQKRIAVLETRLALVTADAEAYRLGLEKIAKSDWRIISGSVGPLMDMGYDMAGQFAVAMAEEALNSTKAE